MAFTAGMRASARHPYGNFSNFPPFAPGLKHTGAGSEPVEGLGGLG